MKAILLSGTAALLLMAAPSAFAQPDQHPNDQHPAGPAAQHNTMSGNTHMSGPAGQHNTMSGNTHMSGPAGQHNTMAPMHPTTTHTTVHRTRTTHRVVHRTTYNSHTTDHTRVNNSVHAKIDINTYRRAGPATHHFSIGVYHAPAHYAYRRYAVGERLEPAFFARDYWLTDWAAYDLMSPPDGYVWVRFGPDAILIDETTGEVVQVQYGIFT